MSYDTQLGIFYMHYSIDMIKHGTAFGECVGGTGGDKLITFRLIVRDLLNALSHRYNNIWHGLC